VDAFHVANPKITVKVTVSDWDTYWDKLQTGIAGGDAPDVFAMEEIVQDWSLPIVEVEPRQEAAEPLPN